VKFFENPLLSVSFSISLFSFAGVPPLIGFFAKQQVLYSSNSAGYFFLSLVAILVSIISASYYLKIINVMLTPNTINTISSLPFVDYKEKFSENYIKTLNGKLSNIHAFIIGILTLSIIFFIFNPEILLNCIAIVSSLILNL
jgi:NADH-ubiquinone oxidoreductase chain 2